MPDYILTINGSKYKVSSASEMSDADLADAAEQYSSPTKTATPKPFSPTSGNTLPPPSQADLQKQFAFSKASNAPITMQTLPMQGKPSGKATPMMSPEATAAFNKQYQDQLAGNAFYTGSQLNALPNDFTGWLKRTLSGMVTPENILIGAALPMAPALGPLGVAAEKAAGVYFGAQGVAQGIKVGQKYGVGAGLGAALPFIAPAALGKAGEIINKRGLPAPPEAQPAAPVQPARPIVPTEQGTSRPPFVGTPMPETATPTPAVETPPVSKAATAQPPKPIMAKNAQHATPFTTEVYHGSSDLRFTNNGDWTKAGDNYGGAIFFSDNPRIAKTYADPKRAFDYQNSEPGVVKRFVTLNNPKVIDAGGESWKNTRGEVAQAKAEGYDGLVIKNVRDAYNALDNPKVNHVGTNVVAFDPSAISKTTQEATAAAPVNTATPAVEPPVTPETPAVPNPAPTAETLSSELAKPIFAATHTIGDTPVIKADTGGKNAYADEQGNVVKATTKIPAVLIPAEITPVPGESTNVKISPLTASIEDVKAGKVAGIKFNPNKSDTTVASRDVGGGVTEVTGKYFDLKPEDRSALLAHELGHDVTAKILSKGLDNVPELEPFRKNSNKPLSIHNANYNNPSGFSELPEEVLSDVYSHLVFGNGKIPFESEKNVNLFNLVAKTAKELNLPLDKEGIDNYYRDFSEENQKNVQPTGLRPVSEVKPGSETNIVVPEQASTTAGEPVERSTETAPETKTGTPEAVKPLTGAKNAITEDERMTRGMSEVNRQAYTGIKDSAEIGRKSVDAGEIDPKALAHSVAEKPRPLDAKEVGALAYDRARITNEHDDATRKLAAASDSKDENAIAQQRARLNLLEEQFDINDQALVKGGREQSAAFNARKMILNSDYTTAGVVNRLKGANPDKPVNPVETKRISDLATALAEANKKIADYEAKQKNQTRSVQNKAAQGVPKFGEKNTVFTSERADAARARLQAKSGRVSAGFDPSMLADIAEIGGYYFEGGVRKFADWAVHMRNEAPGIDNDSLRQVWAQVSNDSKLKGVKTRLTNQIDELKVRLASGKLESPKRIGITYDKEAQALRDKRDSIRYEIDKQIALRQKMNVGDYITRWQRLNVLSGVSTLGKLTAAATGRIVVTPIEDAFGYVLRKTIPGLQKVADIAPGEGTTAGIRGNVEGLKSVFSKQTLIDMKQKVTTGMNSLDLRNQKPGKVEVYHPFMDFFGSVHGALKTPAQRDAFSRALNNYGETALRNGKDLRDPAVQMEAGAYAYQESKRAILQSDNLATNLFQQFIGSANRQGVGGKTVATAAHILTPIVKVPTNYIAESANYIAGGPIGIAKLIAAKARGELKPEEADAVMRAFKKQGVGAGLLALGYFSPNGIQAGGYYGQGQKEKNGVKFGDVKVYGVQIPHLLLHSPAIEALQFGATWRRAMDQTRGKASTDRLGAAAYQSGMGLGEQVPFLDQPIRLGKATENAQGVGKKAGEIVSSIAVPQLVQQGARYLDKNSKGDTIKRYPRGFTDTMKQGIPLLRKQVPSSKPGQGSGVSYKSPKF